MNMSANINIEEISQLLQELQHKKETYQKEIQDNEVQIKLYEEQLKQLKSQLQQTGLIDSGEEIDLEKLENLYEEQSKELNSWIQDVKEILNEVK